MSGSINNVSRSSCTEFNYKTVHTSDINKLGCGVKVAVQRASEMLVVLKNQKLSTDSKVTSMIMNRLEGVNNKLAGEYIKILSLGEEMQKSSYKYAEFKLERLNSFAEKIESSVKKLKCAEDSYKKSNPFLAKLHEVSVMQNAKGLELGEDNNKQTQWVPEGLLKR